MPILKIYPLHDKKHLSGKTKYIMKPNHCTKGLVGATNMNYHGTVYRDYYDEFQNVEEYYGLISTYTERRLGFHLMINPSMKELEYLTDQNLLEIGYRFCLLFPEYQCVFAIHHNTVTDTEDHRHIHVVMHTIDMFTGHIFSAPRDGWHKIVCDLARIMGDYVPAEIMNENKPQEIFC